MKKYIISALIMATAALGTVAVAQSNPAGTPPPPPCGAPCGQQCPDGAPCPGGPCGPCQGDSACVVPQPPCCQAFEGINLTDSQKALIKDLPSPNPTPEQMQQCRNKSRQDYLTNVKAILTPEQYTQFLENAFVNAGGPGGPRGQKGLKEGFRGGKKCDKRDVMKCDKPCKKDGQKCDKPCKKKDGKKKDSKKDNK